MTKGCSGNCSSCSSCNDPALKIAQNLNHVKYRIAVISGKGGVGKSTVSVNTAMQLALAGKKVGLLDLDLHGPSIPKMLKLENVPLVGNGSDRIHPMEIGGLKVMSVGFLLEAADTPLIARGPMKISIIQQFLSDVEWGELDYLIIDLPPGTGDEALTIGQMLPDTYAIIVTTPQNISASDVSRSINFCKQLKMQVLGIVENMSGFVCPKCGHIEYIFAEGAGEALAQTYNVAFLGKIPLDPVVCRGGDEGQPFIQYYRQSPATVAFENAMEPILALDI